MALVPVALLMMPMLHLPWVLLAAVSVSILAMAMMPLAPGWRWWPIAVRRMSEVWVWFPVGDGASGRKPSHRNLVVPEVAHLGFGPEGAVMAANRC